MDETLAGLLRCIRQGDVRLSCAAAVVLSDLAPKDRAVSETLIEALKKADAARKPYLIEALGRIGSPQAAGALLDLAKAGGPSGEEALRALAHAAAGVQGQLAKALPEASPELQEKLAESLARSGSTASFRALLDCLEEAEAPGMAAIRNGIRKALPGLDPKGREALQARLSEALQGKRREEPFLLALMDLAGELGEADSAGALLEHTGSKAPPRLRAAALRAIGRLKLTPERRARLAGRLLPLLEETDFPMTAEPALRALNGAALGSEHRKALQQLIQSQHGEVREFAMRCLAAQGSSRTLADLAACLEHEDPRVREDAAGALAQAKGAAEPLAEKLLKGSSGNMSRTVSRILAPLAKEIPARLLTALTAQYVKLAAGSGSDAADSSEARREADERRGALLAVCREAGKPVLAETALKEAGRLRKAGQAMAARSLLKSIQGVPGWGTEHRLELALAGLSIVPPELTRAARESDANLRLMEEAFAGGGIDLMETARELLKDRRLERKVLYVLGHHFVERMQAEREFGKRILTTLAKQRGEEARQAKEKLVIEGLAKGGGSKRGILEARAEVMMAAADLAAKAAAQSARKAKKKAKKPLKKSKRK